jgi:hypothetical protein
MIAGRLAATWTLFHIALGYTALGLFGAVIAMVASRVLGGGRARPREIGPRWLCITNTRSEKCHRAPDCPATSQNETRSANFCGRQDRKWGLRIGREVEFGAIMSSASAKAINARRGRDRKLAT